MEKDIYSKNTIEFVTVAVEFCSFVENAHELEQASFVDTCAKLLPLLYLKASMLPTMLDNDYMEMVEESVSEEMYEYIRGNIATLLKEKDNYLEVFHEDMQYSETPIVASISENLADIYQDIKNFITIYSYQNEETMEVALQLCSESFTTYWGLRVANALRAIHVVRYSQQDDDSATDSYDTTEQSNNPFFEQQTAWDDTTTNNDWDV